MNRSITRRFPARTIAPVLAATLAVALTGAGVAPALAHHSSAGIDRSKTVSVQGTVKTFRWANPHSWIEMEVVSTTGETELWNFEMLPPSYLIRAGWTRSSVKAGDRITVEANGFINGDPGGLFVSVTLADGTVLTQRAGGRGRGGRGN
jgi:hypothetical protein